MILLLDNYDSFVFNLARYLEELGEAVEVVRNDAVDVAGIRARAPTHLVVSPGPCTPGEAGVAVDAVRELAGETPILGVCLGHQCIAAAFGGRVVRARAPMHGKLSRVRHDGTGLFAGLPDPLTVTRYHSLVVDPAAPGEGLRPTAWADSPAPDGRRRRQPASAGGTPGRGEVMALAHGTHSVWGVQFHPEAILTAAGHALLANFLALGRGRPADGSGGVGAPAELPARLADGVSSELPARAAG